jgi:hypothetical protein
MLVYAHGFPERFAPFSRRVFFFGLCQKYPGSDVCRFGGGWRETSPRPRTQGRERGSKPRYWGSSPYGGIVVGG